ncbi:MAG TPA: hypothetical protein VMW27_00930 [Thermoanaerobaculia bacterium]|nr:hypothetical protein [Thermoanaerobaculia bacterium]
MRIHFVFIGEGSSDEGIIPHLENLCIELGADEVTGTAIDFRRLEQPIGRTVEAKLQAALRLEPEANLFFLHRDSDSRNPDPRHAEISAAVEASKLPRSWVPVVPVQETEAWLLLDETAIRAVAGRPNGRRALDLPRPQEVEMIAHPKERLQNALIDAAEVTGRRLERFRREFPNHRFLLLQRLSLDGPLRDVSSWVRMRDKLHQELQGMKPAGTRNRRR